MRELSTTSYALLALLGVQPFTAYELAQQMERSLADFWPRAQSVLYNEAKNLTAHGLATSERVHTGQRASTRYTITDQGRVALQQWLDTPASGPQLQFEALVQVAFADHGSREQLVRTLDAHHACETFDGFDKFHVIVFHQEVERIAVFATAKAVIEPFSGAHRK